MSFALFVKVEHVVVEEHLLAELAVKGTFRFLDFAQDSRYERLPAIQRLRFPLLIKHLFGLLMNRLEVNERVRFLKKGLQVAA